MHNSKTPLAFSFLVLLAMGNWGNTPSPPLDPDAPDPVGNDGELVLDVDGEKTVYPVQSARLSGETLLLEGEKVGGQTQFSLSASLPAGVINGGVVDTQALRRATLTVSSGVVESRTISAGTITLFAASGSGPWEIDGEVLLSSSVGALAGALQARVRA